MLCERMMVKTGSSHLIFDDDDDDDDDDDELSLQDVDEDQIENDAPSTVVKKTSKVNPILIIGVL